MRLTKSFRLLRFLNARPVWPLRAALAGGGWLGTLAFTRSPTLSTRLWRSLWREPTLKRPMRQLAWYGARSPFAIEPLADPVFDFAEGFDPAARAALTRFVKRGRRDPLRRQLDELTLIAAEVSPPMMGARFDALLARFGVAAAAVFDQLAALPAAPAARPATARTGDFSRADARRALADFAALFPNEQLPWYVISGTFLGLTREGGFLAHDYDIDLGLHAEDADLDAIAARAANSADFALVANDRLRLLHRMPDRSLTEESLPILLKLVHRSGVHIDLFIHYLDGGLRWHGSHVHRWDNTEFALRRHMFEGISVLAPAGADLYLRENYGDWRTPVTEFSPSTGTPNLTVVHNLASVVLAIKRYALARRAGDPLAERLAETLIAAGYVRRTPEGLRFDPSRF